MEFVVLFNTPFCVTLGTFLSLSLKYQVLAFESFEPAELVIDEMISKVRNWESIWQSGTRSFFLILVKSSVCIEFFGIHQFMHLGITFEFDSMFEETLHP